MSEDAASAFNPRTVILLVIAGVVAFGAFLFLAAYAPDLRSGRDGRAHGLSTSAVGFRGIHDLLAATGDRAEFMRGSEIPGGDGLVIVTVEPGLDRDRLDELVRERWGPILIVLPKWATVDVPAQRDRVRWVHATMGPFGAAEISGVASVQVSMSGVAAGTPLATPFAGETEIAAPEALQTISGDGLQPLVQTPDKEIVLAAIPDLGVFVLSDPDLINNQALADPERARAALALLRHLNADGGPYRFELVANGYGGSPNLLTLAFEPPFLALTLCILAAALMAGLQAAFRFGPPLAEPRAIAFGKRALVDNAAQLLRLARREQLSARRYAAMTREAAVAAIGNPLRLEGPALDAWLDRFAAPGSPPFSDLARAAERASTRQDIVDAARALNRWRRTITHEG